MLPCLMSCVKMTLRVNHGHVGVVLMEEKESMQLGRRSMSMCVCDTWATPKTPVAPVTKTLALRILWKSRAGILVGWSYWSGWKKGGSLANRSSSQLKSQSCISGEYVGLMFLTGPPGVALVWKTIITSIAWHLYTHVSTILRNFVFYPDCISKPKSLAFYVEFVLKHAF